MASPMPGAIRDALERVLASRSFQQSEKLARFLRHVVEQTIGGRGDNLKEYSLGVDVFGRGEAFDPRLDSIVRVEASRLRARLAEYYRTEGKLDQMRIELPKGSYVPQFHEAAPTPVDAAPRRARWIAWAAVAAAVCAIGALASMRVLRGPHAGQAPSVAVLPFVDLSAEKGAEYLSDGITEELTNTLARIPNLRVAARSSTFRFKGGSVDPRQMGRQLGVGTVIEGSVRRSGASLRISVQLISTSDGYSLWSGSYDGEERDVLAMQASVAQGIAGSLRLRLTGSEGNELLRRHTRSSEAHDLVLQARYLKPDAADPDARIRCYRRALQLDPEYAQAYVGLAEEWLQRAVEGSAAPRQVMDKAKDSAARALQIDGSLPEAHFLAGVVKWTYDWDWSGAQREFERALQLNPNSAPARAQYARYLALLGRKDEALSQLAQIRVLDPISTGTSSIESAVYYMLGDYDRTIQHARAVLAGEPDVWLMYYWMGRAYDSKGQLPEAVAALERWYGIPGRLQGSGFGMLGSLYARAGRRADAMRLLEDALERSRRTHVSPTSIALVYAGLGDRARAIQWLETAYQERDHSLVAIKTDPGYDPLRSDPKFAGLLHRMKLD